jgi:hypothetical protein
MFQKSHLKFQGSPTMFKGEIVTFEGFGSLIFGI